MRGLKAGFLLAMAWAMLAVGTAAQGTGATAAHGGAGAACERPAAGSAVEEPADLRSENGELRVELAFRSSVDAAGRTNFCYVDKDGRQAPNLRLHPGDTLVLKLKNEAAAKTASAAAPVISQMKDAASGNGHAAGNAMTGNTTTGNTVAGNSGREDCAGQAMRPMGTGAAPTNLHFHGITVPPVCHEDDVLHTMVLPGDAAFEYRFEIPKDEPPGLYWYHPHIHGSTKAQVMGGASGALIVEGIERANPELAGLPERVLVIRDQKLLNPNAAPSDAASRAIPPVVLDADGDVKNTGTGTGKPAKDLSLNYVPVPYPDYPPAVITMKPGERQLWRVLNASAITYLNLAVLYDRKPQELGIVALDGVPVNADGVTKNVLNGQNHIGIPPGGRAEFIVQGPPAGVSGLLVTRTVDTGSGGENDPNRALATLTASSDAPAAASIVASNPTALPPPARPWLGSVTPAHVRKLYFSEKLENPNDPNSATTFYITEDGKTPTAFDPSSGVPDIVVKQGDVEDWIIENRSTELHAFHIHQIHFMMIDWSGVPVNEPFLRDTINVPYYSDRMLQYPSVRLRMDFRDPNTVGTFVYHCHLLEHEDGGMMGTIRVEAAHAPAVSAKLE